MGHPLVRVCDPAERIPLRCGNVISGAVGRIRRSSVTIDRTSGLRPPDGSHEPPRGVRWTVNEHEPSGRHGNLRILLVDDHAFFHVGVSSFLEHVDGFEVVGAARDPRETFEVLERHPVDFALVDISLGRADGLELVKQILSRWPKVRVIMLSMHAERNYAERALRAGARGYVMKSEPPEVLVDAIRRIERGGVYLSERLQAEIAHRFFEHDAAEEIGRASCRERVSFTV